MAIAQQQRIKIGLRQRNRRHIPVHLEELPAHQIQRQRNRGAERMEIVVIQQLTGKAFHDPIDPVLDDALYRPASNTKISKITFMLKPYEG